MRKLEILENDQKIATNEKLFQNIVMDEELVQNNVMSGNFVNNFVMNAKNDPTVVMDLTIFEMGEWNSLQPSNKQLFEYFC